MKSRGFDINYIVKSLSLKTMKLFFGLNFGMIKQVLMNRNITQGLFGISMLTLFRASQMAVLASPAVRVGILLMPFVVSAFFKVLPLGKLCFQWSKGFLEEVHKFEGSYSVP